MDASITIIKGAKFNYLVATLLDKPEEQYVCKVERVVQAIAENNETVNMPMLADPSVHIVVKVSQLKPIIERI